MLTIVQKQSGQTESRLVRGFFLLGAAQSLVAAFIGPLLMSAKHTVAAGTIYYLMDFGAARSSGEAFYFLGYPLALNARWLGVFVGMLCGLLIYDSVAKSLSRINPERLTWLRRTGYLAAVLIVVTFTVDCVTGFLDRTLSAALIFMVGYWFGLVLPFYLIPVVSSCLIVIRKTTHRFFATTSRLRS